MGKDSEEKIVAEWNKIWEPDRLSRAFGAESDKVFPIETGFDSVYRQLEKFAKGSGEKAPRKEVNRGQQKGWRNKMKATRKGFIGLWIRAKNIRKAKKLDLLKEK